MKTSIIKGLSEQQAEEMRQCFWHSAVLREQLKKVLSEKIDASNRIVRSKDAYNVPNWAYLQADAVGYERAMSEVMSLLTGERSTDEVRRESLSVPEVPKAKRGRPRKTPILQN